MATKKQPLADEFLPPNYKLPEGSGYLKFAQGKTKFRFLSSLVTGWEYWRNSSEGKPEPVRSREEPKDTSDGQINEKSGKVDVRHFWSAVVWDYASESVVIAQITQKGIQKYITNLLNDSDWGNPKGYDIVVTREGEGLATKYSVSASPHKEVAPEVLVAYKDANIDLEKLMFEE